MTLKLRWIRSLRFDEYDNNRLHITCYHSKDYIINNVKITSEIAEILYLSKVSLFRIIWLDFWDIFWTSVNVYLDLYFARGQYVCFSYVCLEPVHTYNVGMDLAIDKTPLHREKLLESRFCVVSFLQLQAEPFVQPPDQSAKEVSQQHTHTHTYCLICTGHKFSGCGELVIGKKKKSSPAYLYQWICKTVGKLYNLKV